MPFYTFRQNNSGGFDVGFKYVIVEAPTAREANEIATEYGVYFNGVSKGRDCDCCGDRWYTVSESDADPVPSLYGEPVNENDPSILIVNT